MNHSFIEGKLGIKMIIDIIDGLVKRIELLFIFVFD